MKFYQRIAAFLAAAMLAVATCAIPAHADTADDLAAAQARLEELGAQLNSLQTTLAEQGAQLEDTQYQIDQKQGEIDQTTADLAEARAVLSDRLRSDYKVGAVTFLDVLLQATDFSDLVSRIHYMDSIAKADADAISAVRDLEAQLADQMEELEAREQELEATLAATQEQVDAYAATVAEAQEYYNSLDAKLQEELAAQAAAEAAAEQAAMQAAIEAAENGNEGAASQTEEPSQNEQGNEGSGDNGGSNQGGSQGGQTTPTGPSRQEGGGLATAYDCIGCPYVWGAAGPDSFDCSGLICFCYGWGRGRTTYSMISSLQADGRWVTSMSQLKVGDLIFPSAGHVGIYVGNGQMLHAPHPGTSVCIAQVYSFYGGGTF